MKFTAPPDPLDPYAGAEHLDPRTKKEIKGFVTGFVAGKPESRDEFWTRLSAGNNHLALAGDPPPLDAAAAIEVDPRHESSADNVYSGVDAGKSNLHN